MTFKNVLLGAPGWRSRSSVRLQPGHDLAVPEFEPRVRLWADGSEPGACFRLCVSLSLCPYPVHALSLSVPKINKRWKKKMFSFTCNFWVVFLSVPRIWVYWFAFFYLKEEKRKDEWPKSTGSDKICFWRYNLRHLVHKTSKSMENI